MASDWLGSKENDFSHTCDIWVEVLSNEESVEAYEWKPLDCGEVLGKIDAYQAARDAYANDDSTVRCLKKNEAKDEARKIMREFANTSIRFNKKVDEVTRQYLGIRPKDTVPTTHPRPTSQPDTEVGTTSNRFEHRLSAKNRDSRGSAKPADAYGVRYGWQVGGDAPVTGADLPKGKFSRKTVLTVTYTEADKGKRVWYATCYENAKGDAGPWSALVEAFIW